RLPARGGWDRRGGGTGGGGAGRVDRAWRDPHPAGPEGAGGDRGADVANVVLMGGECLDIAHGERRLFDYRALARCRDDQVRLHVGVSAQNFEQPDTIDRSGGARDPDDESLQRRNLLRKTSSRVFS